MHDGVLFKSSDELVDVGHPLDTHVDRLGAWPWRNQAVEKRIDDGLVSISLISGAQFRDENVEIWAGEGWGEVFFIVDPVHVGD